MSDLYDKYHLLDHKALYRKIDRIVGKFGISNYSDLKIILESDDIYKVLNKFEDLEKQLGENEDIRINIEKYKERAKNNDIVRNNIF